MPRFLFETAPVEGDAGNAAIALAATRYPELAVEHRYAIGGDAGGREVWVCRAPSVAHLRRWFDAAGLTVGEIEPIRTDAGFRGSERPSPGGPRD